MAAFPFQKLKILYVMEYLLRNTDETHPATARDILAYLAEHDITAERKSIYADISALTEYGLDIIREKDGYYIGSRDFELPELKLLVDSVQSSKFITKKKTASLIQKIESLASIYDAQLLNRQVFVANRIKTMNESIYYNVDKIHSGIAKNCKIRFRYFEYTVQKERHYRHNNAFYTISPFALTWDNENYYLVGFDSEAKKIKHFRVDKMSDIQATDLPRDGRSAYEALDMGLYAKKVFGMFSGEETVVTLRFDHQLVGAVLDRLGQDIMLIPDGETHFTVQTGIVVSPPFFGWICSFGDKAQILAPSSVVAQMKQHIRTIYSLYEAKTPSE